MLRVVMIAIRWNSFPGDEKINDWKPIQELNADARESCGDNWRFSDASCREEFWRGRQPPKSGALKMGTV